MESKIKNSFDASRNNVKTFIANGHRIGIVEGIIYKVEGRNFTEVRYEYI